MYKILDMDDADWGIYARDRAHSMNTTAGAQYGLGVDFLA
jgi:hypothetical protein